MAVTYQSLESQVMLEMNAHLAATVAAAESIYAKTTAKADAEVGDSLFFLSRIREAIIDAQQQVIRFICRTEGHPRRVNYRTVQSVAHRGTLPSAMAYGAVYYGSGSTSREMDELAPSDITSFLNDAGASNGVAAYYYAKSGNMLLCTVTPVNVETFDYTRPVSHASGLAALFDSTSDVIGAPDEFVPAIVHLACGHLALTAGSYQEQAAAHFQVAKDALEGAGVRVETGDFGDVRPAQKVAERGN